MYQWIHFGSLDSWVLFYFVVLVSKKLIQSLSENFFQIQILLFTEYYHIYIIITEYYS